MNDHDYCYVEMPSEENKILKYNHGEKPLKAPVYDLCRFMQSVCFKKCLPVKIILKNLIQRKKLSIYLLAIHC